MTTTHAALVDMAVSPLVEKAGWEEFRRKIKDVAMAWNYREWIQTCALDSQTWEKVKAAGGRLVMDGAKLEEKLNVADDELAAIMAAAGVKIKDVDFFQSTVQFVSN